MSLLLVSRRRDLVDRLHPDLHAVDREAAEPLLAQCHLVVLDLDAGWELLARCPCPVLGVASSLEQLVRALDGGIGDAVLHEEELEARLRALRRRHRRPQRVRLESRRALVDGRALELSAREYEVLSLLVGSPGRTFSREELGVDDESRRVDLVVSKLRRKLREPLIHSVWGVGYRYEE